MVHKPAKSRSARSRPAVRERSRHYLTDTSGDERTLPVHYIESSALLSALLEEDAGVLAVLAPEARCVTSALTFAECFRALVRARATGRITSEAEQIIVRALQTFQLRCASIPLTEEVLERAGRPFPVEPVRTLDAVHLASLEVLGLPRGQVTVVTRDNRIRDNAALLGYVVR